MSTGFESIDIDCKVDGAKRTLTLEDVWFVPEAGFNLISEGQLKEQEFPLAFVPGGIEFGKQRFFFRRTKNRLYALDTWGETPLALAVINGEIPAYDESPAEPNADDQEPLAQPEAEAEIDDETLRMWHARHGHLGIQNLKKLAKMCVGMNLSIPPPVDACEPCSVANMKVEPHRRHIAPGRWENDLIHSDLQGPFPTSHDGFEYMITFLCDKTFAL